MFHKNFFISFFYFLKNYFIIFNLFIEHTKSAPFITFLENNFFAFIVVLDFFCIALKSKKIELYSNFFRYSSVYMFISFLYFMPYFLFLGLMFIFSFSFELKIQIFRLFFLRHNILHLHMLLNHILICQMLPFRLCIYHLHVLLILLL